MLIDELVRANALAFWSCVSTHKAELVKVHVQAGCLALDEAEKILHRYDPSLGFEVSQREHMVEMTITAYGRQENFEFVKRLVELCPEISGLRAYAFRRAEGAEFELRAEDRLFRPSDVYFEPMKGRLVQTSIGLMIFFSGGDDIPSDKRLEYARIMIQAILGEYEATTLIDCIEVATVAAKDLSKYIQLTDLAAYLEWSRQRNPPTAH
jgi:hypothetical protein